MSGKVTKRIDPLSDLQDEAQTKIWQQQVAKAVNGLLFPEDWHEVGATNEPAFENSWVNSDALSNTAGFYKDPFGRVHVKGLIKDGTIGNVPCFTLPEGYRPEKDSYFTSYSNGAFGGIAVTSDGEIRARVGNNTWFSLDEISFRAAE